MPTRRIASLVLVIGSFVGSSTAVSSQETHVWSDIDCSLSKIAAPAGFKCRATQEYSGGQGTSTSNAGGQFRRWTAAGTVNNVRLYYYLHEAIGTGSNVRSTETLEERIRQLGAKGDKNFTPTSQLAGADYVRYEGPAGQPCVGIRKYGPSTSGGSRWIIVGTRCVQKGMTISDQDIANFMASADYRK